MVLQSPVATQFQTEDRTQSGGTEICSRINQLHRVNALAHKLPMPSDLTVRLIIAVMGGRGISLSVDEAVDWLRTFAAAEQIGAEHTTLTDT